MTKILLREPPARSTPGRRPVMPLDARILEVAAVPRRPVEIARILREPQANADGSPALDKLWPGITTQRVASRLKALVGRGYMERIRPTGGPANGPGTSLYRAKRDGDDDTDG